MNQKNQLSKMKIVRAGRAAALTWLNGTGGSFTRWIVRDIKASMRKDVSSLKARAGCYPEVTTIHAQEEEEFVQGFTHELIEAIKAAVNNKEGEQ